ncbi:DUF4232 domain-containing protein [Dactylosporangium sp. CA-233914]|uniref:DUF4232 domain-containing protein n=1 Tax=Dactylosporangium sp. CA-233914 TaxID=3239934 RepID=UPI003D92615C
MRRRLAVPLLVCALLAACAKPAPPGTVLPTTAWKAAPSPTQEATGCPEGGLRIVADRGDAAAGYREMSLHLTNCGDTAVTVNGRPEIVVLGEDKSIQEISVVPSQHWSQSPHPVALAPGQSTTAVLAWRNTYTASDEPPVSGVYLSVAATPGGPRQLVKPPVPLDLGNTGRLEVSVWL